jgi:hypothetical protein
VDAGTAPTFGAVSASDTVEVGNGLNVLAEYKSSSGSVTHVTFVAPGNTNYGEPLPDHTVAIPANGTVLVPVRRDYSDGGRATVTTTDNASLTVRVIKVG